MSQPGCCLLLWWTSDRQAFVTLQLVVSRMAGFFAVFGSEVEVLLRKQCSVLQSCEGASFSRPSQAFGPRTCVSLLMHCVRYSTLIYVHFCMLQTYQPPHHMQMHELVPVLKTFTRCHCSSRRRMHLQAGTGSIISHTSEDLAVMHAASAPC